MSIQANALYKADCLALLERIESERVQLVYLDPPWATSLLMSAGDVTQSKRLQEYLLLISRVAQQTYRVLTNSGNLFIRMTPNLSSYIRLILDQVFGKEHFQQEIIWPVSPITVPSKLAVSLHEVIFHYSKTDYYTYSPPRKPRSEDELRHNHKRDTRGPYILRTLVSSAPMPGERFEWKGFVPPYGRYWRFPQEQLEQLDAEGRIDAEGQFPRLKIYLDEIEDVEIGSVWNDIPRASFAERTQGYIPQQPISLLERIVVMGSEPGDLVLDPFCGSGTTLATAHASHRRWIGCDALEQAVAISVKRLETLGLVPHTDYELGDNESLLDYPILHHFYSPLVLRLDQALQPTFILGQVFDPEEDLHYEFKEVKSQSPARTIKNALERYIVCFLNAEGGFVYWGIRDSDREILGVNLSYEQRDEIRQILAQKTAGITPPIDPTVCRIEFYPVYDRERKAIDDHWIVELVVPFVSDKPVYYRTRSGELRVKMGGVCSKLTPAQEEVWIKGRLGQ